MAGYTIAADIGGEVSDVTFTTGGIAAANLSVYFNDGVTRDEAIRMLNTIADRLESTTDSEPPAAFS